MATSEFWRTKGSILGPLLFLIYTDDITQVVKQSEICLLADDVELFIKLHDSDDCLKLKNDLKAVNERFSAKGMCLNNSKCKVLKVTCKRNPIDFVCTINGNSAVM